MKRFKEKKETERKALDERLRRQERKKMQRQKKGFFCGKIKKNVGSMKRKTYIKREEKKMSGERLWERDHEEMILKVGEMKDKKQ